jgi:hypothetical protein
LGDYTQQVNKGCLAVSDKGRLKSIKQQLAVLIRRGNYRVPFEKEYPKKWCFGEVVDPRSRKYFTPAGAWDFIAEQLEERGTTITEVILEKPPGKKGYVLKTPTRDGIMYVKIQFGVGGNIVLGRSFHYSEER